MIEPDSANRVFDFRYGDHPLAGTGFLRSRGCSPRNLVVLLSQSDAAIREDVHAVRRLLMRLSVFSQASPGKWAVTRDGV